MDQMLFTNYIFDCMVPQIILQVPVGQGRMTQFSQKIAKVQFSPIIIFFYFISFFVD